MIACLLTRPIIIIGRVSGHAILLFYTSFPIKTVNVHVHCSWLMWFSCLFFTFPSNIVMKCNVMHSLVLDYTPKYFIIYFYFEFKIYLQYNSETYRLFIIFWILLRRQVTHINEWMNEYIIMPHQTNWIKF